MAKTLTEIVVKLPEQSQHRYMLAPGEYLIGRDPSCQIVVDSPDVSQRHARLRLGEEELWLEDLGSSNGTSVAGERLAGPIRLRPPQRIELGKAVLEIKQVAEAAAGTPTVADGVGAAGDLVGLAARAERYTVGRLVAQGGMGAILDAQDGRLCRRVALKRLRAGPQASRESLLRFAQEARVLGQLEHPNIVPVYDLELGPGGELFYAMKFVKGVTLHQVLAKIKAGDAATVAKYPLAQLLTIFQKVCDAVGFAHSRGVIHRDLKPENIMLGEYGEVLVMDWGLAKILAVEGPAGRPIPGFHDADGPAGTAGPQTIEGKVMGTPNFMAPEQAEGRVGELDARTDVFALGGILYHLLTLSPPVSGTSTAEILEKIKQGAIPPPSTFNPSAGKAQRGEIVEASRVALLHCPDRKIPAALSAVAMKALAREPAQRYQTVGALQADIAAYQGGYLTSAEESTTWKQLALAVRRRKTEFTLGAVALLVILALVAGFTLKITRALAELHRAAPAFAAEAQSLVEEGKFEPALAKLTYAISLKPNDAGLYYLKGNLHESLLQFDQARDAYLQALKLNPNHAQASENLLLCQKLLTETKGAQSLSGDVLRSLRLTMVQQQRFAEAQAVAARLGKEEQRHLEDWRTELSRRGVKGTLTIDPEGELKLDLTQSGIRDLTPLRGLPLTSLLLTGCTNVTDLTPLQGMRLRELNFTGTQVGDLGPLRGLPLRQVWLGETPVSDLTPLKGMRLQTLSMGGTRVSDISVLKGMPLGSLLLGATRVSDLSPLQGMTTLWWLFLDQTPVSDLRPLAGSHLHWLSLCVCLDLHDLTPLAQCQELDTLTIPEHIEDIEFLRRLPNLKKLGYTFPGWRAENVPSAADFWREYDAKKK